MLLERIYDEDLAQASYVIGCQATGEAIVIDPRRDVDEYMRLADKHGLRIAHVTRDPYPRRLPLRHPRVRGARRCPHARLRRGRTRLDLRHRLRRRRPDARRRRDRRRQRDARAVHTPATRPNTCRSS